MTESTPYTIRDHVFDLVDQYARRKPAAGQGGLFDDPSEKQRPLFSKKPEDEGGRWLTINGAHVYVSGEDDRILKGPKHFVGKTTKQIADGDGRKGEEKPPAPKPLAELGKITGGRPDNRQQRMFETIHPGLFKDEFEKAFRAKMGVGIDKDVENPSPPPAEEKPEPKESLIDFLKGSMNERGMLADKDGNERGGDWFRSEMKKRNDSIPEQQEAIRWLRKHGTPAQQRWQLGEFSHDLRMNTREDEPAAGSEETFTLQRPPAPAPAKPDFGNNFATKQGGLFDAGKKDELKGQELLFNSDAGDVANPKTMENRAKAAAESGPQQGDTDENGLIFRNDRWHRDGKEIDPSAIAQSARDNGENIWAAAKKELGVQSMIDIPPELRKELGDAMAATSAGKAPEVKPPSAGRARAMEKQAVKEKEKPVEPAAIAPDPLPSPAETKPTEPPKSIKDIVTKAVSKKMEDFGEYIPGARKEGAKKTGPRVERDDMGSAKPGWARRYSVSQIAKSSNKSEEGKWSVTDSKQKDWLKQPKHLGNFDTQEEAEKAIPLMEVARNHRTREMPDGTHAIIRDVAKGKYPVVKGGFKSDLDAKRHMVQHPEEIIEHKFPKYESVQYLDTVKRDGPEVRKGDKDIKPDDFQKAFKLRGGQFGNWNAGKDGQTSLNHAYDSFHDLADVLGIDPSAITMNGDLAMAFGARGTGGENSARAHYEPDERIINLTKMKGAGSLAHEWAHALDHMIAGGKDSKHHSAIAMKTRFLEDRPEVKTALNNLEESMFTSEKDVIPDGSLAKKQIDRQSEHIKGMFDNLEKEWTSSYGKKKKKLTVEDLNRWNELKEKAIKADVEPGQYYYSNGPDTPANARNAMSGLFSNSIIREMNAIHKKITGRSFHTNADHSVGKTIYAQMERLRDANSRASQAEAGTANRVKSRSNFMNEALDLDKKQVGNYYSQREEMMARAFEAYIHDKLDSSDKRSDYLIGKGKTNNAIYRAFDIGAPFPEGEEKTRINAAFDKLFDTLRGNELKSAPSSSAGKEKYSRSRSSYVITLNDAVHQSVDRYCRDQFIPPIDQYAHPLVHAAVGGLAHVAVQSILPGGILKKIAHAAVTTAMAAWISSSNAAMANQAAQNPALAPIPMMNASQHQQAGNSIFDQIAANAMARHDARKQAEAASPPSPNVQHAQATAAAAGARAGVRPITEPGSQVAGGQTAGKGGATGARPLRDPGDDHPRETTMHDGKRPGEFAPKGEGQKPAAGGSADGAEPPSSPAENSGSASEPKKPHDELIRDFAEKWQAKRAKSAPAPNPRKAMTEGRSEVPLQPVSQFSSEELKAQAKEEKQAEKVQADKVSFDPSKLEAESSKTVTERQAKKSIIPDVASEHDLDHDLLSHVVDEELKMLLPAHQRQEEARQYISKLGWHAGRINRKEDSYEDHSTTNLDESASEWAGLFPEIAGHDESEWVAKMWELSRQGKQDPPSANDEDLVRSVAKRLVDQGYAQGASTFPAEEGSDSDSDSDSNLQPVHGSPGDADYTPFSRAYVEMIVDKYLRIHGVC